MFLMIFHSSFSLRSIYKVNLWFVDFIDADVDADVEFIDAVVCQKYFQLNEWASFTAIISWQILSRFLHQQI